MKTEPRQETEATASIRERFGRALFVAWAAACLGSVVVLVAARWLRYTSFSSAPPFDRVLPELMVVDVHAFVWPWVYSTLKLPILVIALAVIVLGFHRRLPGLLLRPVAGVWQLTPIATAAILGALVWLQYFLDINPTVTLACGSSLALLAVLEHPRAAAALPTGAARLAVVVSLAGWAATAWDTADRIAIAAWALFLLMTQAIPAARTRRRDVALLRVMALMPANLLAAVLPIVLPWHGGTFLGSGLAYSFCEVPDRETVYATIPVCDSVNATYADCKDGRVVEYDRKSLQQVSSHNYFSPDFHGRLELMECLDDEVQVAIQASVIHGKAVIQSTLAFPVAEPTTFTPVLAGPGIGITIAYDRAHEALFYTSEFNHRVVRYDRRTQQLVDVGGDALVRRWFQPVLLNEHTGSSILYTHSIHPGRNRIYLAEWFEGRYAYAIDLTSLQIVARYDVGGGGALGITVDPERDRLVVSSTWGIEVFDLTNDTLIARHRLGLGNRPAILDAARNRFYVASTVEGKIRILDRDTFATIGQIPIGLGTRFAHLSIDGQRLYASSAAAHFAWDANALVRSN